MNTFCGGSGTHEIHRTFKPSPDSSRGYLSIVFSRTMPDPSSPKADPDEPDVTARLSFFRDAMGEREPIDIVREVITLLIAKTCVTAVAISRWQQTDETVMLGFFFNRAEGQGMNTIVNAMTPKDPDLERQLQKAFYL